MKQRPKTVRESNKTKMTYDIQYPILKTPYINQKVVNINKKVSNTAL